MHLSCKVHDCVNLLCIQNVAEQVPALYVTLDELQHISCLSFATPCVLISSAESAKCSYLEVWVLFGKLEIVQRGTVIQFVKNHHLTAQRDVSRLVFGHGTGIERGGQRQALCRSALLQRVSTVTTRSVLPYTAEIL